MPATSESRARTRAFARVIGPYVAIIPTIIAVRAPEMGSLHFFESPIIVWFAGALLFGSGLFIIANHQYWSSAAAIAISLFGWFLALRGVALLIAPDAMQRGVDASQDMIPLVRVGFGALAAVGVWLTFVGWIAKLPAAPPSASAAG
jgi:hypothetical protein